MLSGASPYQRWGPLYHPPPWGSIQRLLGFCMTHPFSGHGTLYFDFFFLSSLPTILSLNRSMLRGDQRHPQDQMGQWGVLSSSLKVSLGVPAKQVFSVPSMCLG